MIVRHDVRHLGVESTFIPVVNLEPSNLLNKVLPEHL